MNRFLIMIGLALLAGCSSTAIPLTPSTQCDEAMQYCIDFGNSMNFRQWTNDWSDWLGRDTKHTISNGINPEDADYLLADFYETESCSPIATGASSMQPSQNTNGITIWGRVDAYDSYQPSFPEEETPFCRPPILEWDGDMETGIERISNYAAYALCSEKDGKRVLICISQMTDNLQLAEGIFRTFRWTK